jgi:hypothetical protein
VEDVIFQFVVCSEVVVIEWFHYFIGLPQLII